MSTATQDEGKRASNMVENTLLGEEKDRNIYKDFFQKKNIVLCGHNVLTWGSDISHGISTLRIKQKLPTKIYCGANFNNSGDITFGTQEGYGRSDNSREPDVVPFVSLFDRSDISPFLKDFLINNNYTGGVHIDFLSEIPSGHGFASSSTFSVLLTYLMFILIGKLSPKILQLQELSFSPLLREELYAFSLELSSIISGGNSIGASNYAIMAENMPLPIVHFSEKCNYTETHGGNIMNDENTHVHIPVHRTIYKDSLINFFSLHGEIGAELPIDFGIIYSGIPYHFSDIIATRNQERTEKKSIVARLNDTLLYLKKIDEKERDILQKFFENYENDSLGCNVDEWNLEILHGLGNLMRNEYGEYSISKFIEVIQKAGLFSFSHQKRNKLYIDFQYFFYTLRQFENEEIGILPFNSGKIGGSFLFVMQKGKSQQTLEKVLRKIKEEGYETTLDYASWKDGTASRGIYIEQFISEKIYSSYTREGDVYFMDTHGISYSGEYDMIIQKENRGILLDTIGGRIYIKGNKLTSKEIHSQNTTIDMLSILMESLGSEVSNGKLPVSTYSQNKNEILGKVVLPIKKLAQKHFSQELSLTCSGGITEYYLRLEKDENIPIGILKRLSS